MAGSSTGVEVHYAFQPPPSQGNTPEMQKLIEEVDEKDIEGWISGVLPDDRLRDFLLEKMSQFKMRMSIESASARVLALTTDFHKDYGWERLFEGAEGKKRRVKKKLQNAFELRLKAMMTASARVAHAIKDPDSFTDCLAEAAVYYRETSRHQRGNNKRFRASESTTFKVQVGQKVNKTEDSRKVAARKRTTKKCWRRE